MNETTDASAMFAPIWRRKWLILSVALLVAVGTYLYYRHQKPTYQATTQIYLGAGAEEQVPISGSAVSLNKKSTQPQPAAQAILINSAIVKSSVKKQLRAKPKTKAVRAALTGKYKAKASEKSQFINLSSEAKNAQGAVLLANTVAETYVDRQNSKYKHSVESAIALTRRQLHRIEETQELRAAEEAAATKKGGQGGAASKAKGSSTSVALQIAQLSTKINQLESALAITTVRQVAPARPKQLSASPRRNAIFGFLLGLILASFAAYALARVDTRLRTLADMEEALGAQILTAVPAVRRPIVHGEGPPRPSNLVREPLQRLHTSLQVAGSAAGHAPRTILFLSAQSGDGKSTMAADLALIQRDAGAAVAIVEADLRRPTLARMLRVNPDQGLAEVLAGQLGVREAMQRVGGIPPAPAAPPPPVPIPHSVATMVEAPVTGSASVLVGGMAANPSALLAGPQMRDTLHAIAEEHDYVLLDAPPPLEVSDVIPLMRLVDAIVIVARAGQTREAAARRLVQLLAHTPSAPVLGVVANGVSDKDIEKYGFSKYSTGRSWRSRLFGP